MLGSVGFPLSTIPSYFEISILMFLVWRLGMEEAGDFMLAGYAGCWDDGYMLVLSGGYIAVMTNICTNHELETVEMVMDIKMARVFHYVVRACRCRFIRVRNVSVN